MFRSIISLVKAKHGKKRKDCGLWGHNGAFGEVTLHPRLGQEEKVWLSKKEKELSHG